MSRAQHHELGREKKNKKPSIQEKRIKQKTRKSADASRNVHGVELNSLLTRAKGERRFWAFKLVDEEEGEKKALEHLGGTGSG